MRWGKLAHQLGVALITVVAASCKTTVSVPVPAGGCDGVPSGSEESRVRYAATTVPFGESCAGETQVRTCDQGAWSAWSGSNTAEVCIVESPPSGCGAVANGGTEGRPCYHAASVPDDQTCAYDWQTRTCDDGGWVPAVWPACANLDCFVQADDAACVSITAPATVTTGQAFSATVVMQNTGTTTWASADATPHRLGSQNPPDNGRWGTGRVALAADVLPGANATFAFTATAPAAVGTYAFDWSMVEDGAHWFGATCATSIVVQGCGDGVQNNGETDVDCGGGCAPCVDGKRCTLPGDCGSGSCYQGQCLTARVRPTAANVDYFLSRSCYGIWAYMADTAGDTPEMLASYYRGCKHIRWTEFTWHNDGENPAVFPGYTATYFARIKAFADAVHAHDPEVVIEVGLAEYTCVPLYNRTAYDFSQFPALAGYGYTGTGVFDGAAIAQRLGMWGFDCVNMTTQGATGWNSGATNLGSAETLRLYTWLAANYARAGVEAFYLPQADLTSNYTNWTVLAPVVQRLHEVGALYGRRGSVLVASEVYHKPTYDSVLVDGSGRGVVDYLKAIPEIDWVRDDPGAWDPAAKPTTAGGYSPSCVEEPRIAWESRLGRRLSVAQGDLCFVDNNLGYRNGDRFSSAYGQQEANRTNAFWLASVNTARIPTILELDGCQPALDRGTGPWDGLIRNGIWPQVRFFSSRSAATRQSFERYAPWAARSLFAREGVPVYSVFPVKEDQANGACVSFPYPEETYCPGTGTWSEYYLAQAGFCNDLSVVRHALEFAPADRGLVFSMNDGRVIAIGGGYRLDLRHQPGDFGADPVVDVELRADQTGYDVLTAGGVLRTYPAATQVTGLTGARDLETAGSARLVLLVDGGQCAIATSADGFAGRTRITGCTQPARLAANAGGLALLERTGTLWVGSGAGSLAARTVLLSDPDAALTAGDFWVDVELRPQDGELIVASAYGLVVRVRANDSVEPVQAAKWTWAAGVDVEHMTVGGGTFLYMLDAWGGLHWVPVDGQTPADFPDLYPSPYYSGVFANRYVGLQAVVLR